MHRLKTIIRYKIFTRISKSFLKVVINILGPKLCAFLTYKSLDFGIINREKKTIVCLFRESFIKDIIALRRYGNFNYIVVTAGFTRCQQAWLPEDLVEQTFYQKNIHNYPKEVSKSLVYAETLFSLINKKHPVSGFLSGNFDYWQDHYFKVVANIMKIPFLVISREHPVIPEVCKLVKERYARAKYQYIGDAIAVAGRSTYDVISESGYICSENKVRITGLPRYDDWRCVTTNKPLKERRYITLLTFTNGYHANETFKEVLNVFCEIAKNNTSIKYVVKTKDYLDTQIIKQLIKNKHGYPNLIISDTMDLFELLPDSKLVIGYNSLSIIEALMSGAQIAIPNWGQCTNSGSWTMYAHENQLVREIIRFPENYEDFERLIRSAINGDNPTVDSTAAAKLIQQYIYYPENHTSTQEFEELFLECEKNCAQN